MLENAARARRKPVFELCKTIAGFAASCLESEQKRRWYATSWARNRTGSAQHAQHRNMSATAVDQFPTHSPDRFNTKHQVQCIQTCILDNANFHRHALML